MIELKNVSKKYNDSFALDNISLKVCKGEFFVLLGESGSGKSTLLRTINGLISHDSGEILIDGKKLEDCDLLSLRRDIGYVVQSTGLFPNMNVYQNISIVPNLLKWDKKVIQNRVIEMLSLMRLDPDKYLTKFPNELSGGEAQRIGVARALAADQSILLMDEPFGALDPITRTKLQGEIIRIQRKLQKTIVFVTHDIVEAIKLADRVAIMSEGKLLSMGTPLDVLRDNSDFVRGFLGSDSYINILSKYRVGEFLNFGEEVQSSISLKSDSSLKDALNIFIRYGVSHVNVINEAGSYLGYISLEKIITLFNGEKYAE